MSSSQAGLSPAVTSSGSCERALLVGSTEHVVRQTWRLHVTRDLQLTTTIIDPRKKGRVGVQNTAFPVATEAALSLMASQKADEVIKGKRDAHEKAVQNSGVPPTRGSKKRGADGNMTCPVMAAIAALHPGRRTRTSSGKQPAGPAADPEVRHSKGSQDVCVL